MKHIISIAVLLLLMVFALRRCDNAPWPQALLDGNSFFVSYPAQIKTLDPQSASYAHEHLVIGCVVEPALHYHYLKRPYQLEPQLLEEMPRVECRDAQGRTLPDDAPDEMIASVIYTLKIRPGIHYQPHPAFAAGAKPTTSDVRSPADYSSMATRELVAEDFKTAAVRLCDPKVGAVLYSTFASFLAGMDECAKRIAATPANVPYAQIHLAGCKVIDRYTVQFILKRKYPQFLYWLAMNPLAPIPQEALDFYERSRGALTYSQWPVGTGPFMLKQSELNRRIVLVTNPEFRQCLYPSEGSPDDRTAGLLEDAGKKLPFLEQVVFNFEREPLPAWLKFRQGYYDTSGVPNDMFDSAMTTGDASGKAVLSPELEQRGIRLTQAVPLITYYLAFNMLDPVVGGLSEQKCLLRQALSIAIDANEYVALFRLGNGIPAQGIIPPGIDGEFGCNAVVNVLPRQRKSLEYARTLMQKAGYPGGIDPSTGAPLVIHMDHAAAGMPDFKSRFQWFSARLRALGVELRERPTDLNRNRELLRKGSWQMLCERGWVADYPDPENFLFLFYSRNAHAQATGAGPNYTNYASAAFDRIFLQLETMQNGPERLELINQANQILAHDAPECFLFHPINAILEQQWLKNSKPTALFYDYIKYLKIDSPQKRRALQREWN